MRSLYHQCRCITLKPRLPPRPRVASPVLFPVIVSPAAPHGMFTHGFAKNHCNYAYSALVPVRGPKLILKFAKRPIDNLHPREPSVCRCCFLMVFVAYPLLFELPSTATQFDEE